MYIIKNAWRNIVRSLGRNILIGIIVLVIALSSCVALSIRRAADTAREEALGNIKITAQISLDRQKLMENNEDRESMQKALQNAQELTVDELQKYAEAQSVEDFYYTLTTAMNAAGKLKAVDATGAEEDSDSDSGSSESSETGLETSSSTAKAAAKAISPSFQGMTS